MNRPVSPEATPNIASTRHHHAPHHSAHREQTRLARFLAAEPIYLLVLAPLFLFPAPFTTPVLLVVPGLWLVRRLTARHFVLPNPLNWVLVLLWLTILISLFVTYDIAVSLPKIAGLVLGIGLFFAFARWASEPGGLRWSLLIFVGSGLAVGLVGGSGMAWTDKFDSLNGVSNASTSEFIRLPGLENAIQPNEVAGALAWVIPLPIVLLAWAARHSARLAPRFGPVRWLLFSLTLLVVSGLMAGVLVLTHSRSSYIGLALALLLALWVASPRWLRWITAGLGAIGLAILAIIFGGDLPALLVSILGGRLEIWARGLFGLQDFPFTGFGLNTFRYLAPALYPFSLFGPVQDIGHAHNEFLQAGLDLGIPGLMAFIALYLGAGWMAWQAGKSRQSVLYLKRNRHIGVEARTLTIGLSAGLAAHALFGLTDAVSLGAKPGFLFWMLLGLLAGIYLQVSAPASVAES